MSTRKLVAAAVLLAFTVVLAFFLLRPPAPSPPATPPPPAAESIAPSATSPPPRARPDLLKDPARATVLPRTADGFIEWTDSIAAAKSLNAPAQSAAEDLGIVRALLGDYHVVFHENPPGGENAEITRALLGDNPKKIRFLAPEKTLLDADGALLDRWGEPYFFHKLSRDTMDLRSAGADRRMFTPDDILDEAPGDRPPL